MMKTVFIILHLYLITVDSAEAKYPFPEMYFLPHSVKNALKRNSLLCHLISFPVCNNVSSFLSHLLCFSVLG